MRRAALLSLLMLLPLLTPPAEAASPTSPPAALQGERVAVPALLAEMREALLPLREDPGVRGDYAALAAAHRLPTSVEGLAEYIAVRAAFEATRSGGWWGVQWTITDKEPTSADIWTAWAAGEPTVLAECDEISALFAVVARQLGADRVGLFWPTSNHTVAVWTVSGVRVVVPTTPIFLSPGQTLGTGEMDPHTQRTIYTYGETDGALGTSLPGAAARRMLAQVRWYAAASPAVSQRLRDLREEAHLSGWSGAELAEATAGMEIGVSRRADLEAIAAFRAEAVAARGR